MSPKTYAWFTLVMFSVIAILASASLLSSCAVPSAYIGTDKSTSEVIADWPIVRIIDNDAGVVCYLYAPSNQGRAGLSCLPLSETSLPYGD